MPFLGRALLRRYVLQTLHIILLADVFDRNLSVEVDACSPFLLFADPLKVLPFQNVYFEFAIGNVEVSGDHHPEIHGDIERDEGDEGPAHGTSTSWVLHKVRLSDTVAVEEQYGVLIGQF